MLGKYFLMHKDIKIAIFELDDSLQIVNIAGSKSGIGKAHLPKSDMAELKKWILNRGIPVTRDNIKLELAGVNVNSTFELMLKNNGLSLLDHYWICKCNSDYNWHSINLYENNFKAKYSLDLKDDIGNIADKTNFIPSASLKGDLRKKWIIDSNGVRRLVKGNYGIGCRQSICEVLATEMHKRQGIFKYTPYSLIDIASNGQLVRGCECPNFTSEQAEFIPAIEIIEKEKKPNNISYYEYYIEKCLNHGLDIRDMMEYQIMMDFIISNSDRHLNNFGILRDSTTLQWLSYAPIFDSGNSMFYKSGYIPVDKELLKLEVTSFKSKEVQLLKYVTNKGLIDTKLLPSDMELYKILKQDNTSDSNTNEKLVKAYIKKIKYFIDFQNGAKIWEWGYKG